MKGYTRSYILGSVLVAAAFLTIFFEPEYMPFTSSQASWVLFLGGVVLILVGWREQNKTHNDQNK